MSATRIESSTQTPSRIDAPYNQLLSPDFMPKGLTLAKRLTPSEPGHRSPSYAPLLQKSKFCPLSASEIDTTFLVAMAELWTPDCATNVTMIADPTLPAAQHSPSSQTEPDTNNGPPPVYLSNPEYTHRTPEPSVMVGFCCFLI